MLAIRRTCTNRIISRALAAEGKPLVGLLRPGAEDWEICLDRSRLQARLNAEPDTIIVYNQQPEARALVDELEVSAEQVFVEIRQDTRGVLGLQAYHQQGHAAEALELLHE